MSELISTIDPTTIVTLTSAYRHFNSRDIDGALTTMQPNVEWPNGMEGGVVNGHSGVRAYWTHQWKQIDPHVDPVKIEPDHAGRIAIQVHQVLRDLNGTVLVDRMVEHLYSLEGGLIRSMEIRET